jgi:hypothetical protein
VKLKKKSIQPNAQKNKKKIIITKLKIYIYIYIANWDGRIKLKTNKTSIRGSRKKIQNQKNKD